MKKLLTAALLISFYTSYSQEYRIVERFNKILVGLHVELILPVSRTFSKIIQ